MKKILIIGLIVILSIGVIGCNSATDEKYLKFDSGSGTITGYNSNGGPDVVIPSEINGFEVTKIQGGMNFAYGSWEQEPAFFEKGLTSVEIPDSVKEIGEHTSNNNALREVKIPDSVEKIGREAFRENDLQSVEIHDNVELITHNAFDDNVELVNWDEEQMEELPEEEPMDDWDN